MLQSDALLNAQLSFRAVHLTYILIKDQHNLYLYI